MDDLKLFPKVDDNLEGLLQTVRNFSNDIEMKFGPNRCAKAAFEIERLVKPVSINLGHNAMIKEPEQEKAYK